MKENVFRRVVDSNRQNRRNLKQYGLNQSLQKRFGPAAFLLFAAGVASFAAWWVSGHGRDEWRDAYGIDSLKIAGMILTLAGLGLTYYQWRAARHETSLEKYYDRLDKANNRLIDWANERGIEKLEHAAHMYIFAELDNLEYAIEKYKLGYMNPDLAWRALRTFRCRFDENFNSPDFFELAPRQVLWGEYNASTRAVVDRIVQQYSAGTLSHGASGRPSAPSLDA